MAVIFFKKKNKFNAEKTSLDGFIFDSEAEAKRYGELKLLEKDGNITGLTIHPRSLLIVHKKIIGIYEADFSYESLGHPIVEDVKGMITPLAKWKIKHFEAQYGIKVRIIKLLPLHLIYYLINLVRMALSY
jgi:Protein of unknown function (DUF1064)